MVEVQHHQTAPEMNLENLETPGTQTIMNQGQNHAHRGRKEGEITQEEDIEKSIETLHGIETEIGDTQTEAAAEKGEMIKVQTGIEDQAMAEGAAERVARSP